MLLGTLGASLLGNLLSEKQGIVENQGQDMEDMELKELIMDLKKIDSTSSFNKL